MHKTINISIFQSVYSFRFRRHFNFRIFATLKFIKNNRDLNNFFFSQILFPLKKATKTTLHLNISSIGSHIDGLRTFLIFLGVKFDIIWISESWITKNLPPVKNINFPGFNIEKTSTKSTACGTIMCISQNISSKALTDLNIYSAKEMETT